MPWSLPGQDKQGYCQKCTHCKGNRCITCAKSGGTQTRTRSIRLHRGRLNIWSCHVVLSIALSSLLVPTCVQFATIGQIQETRGEPLPRPLVRALRTHLHPPSVELSIFLRSLWQQLQTSVRNRPSTSICKQPAYKIWTDLPRQTCPKCTGQPGQAPSIDRVSDVTHLRSQLQTGVTSKLEGYHHAMDSDLKRGVPASAPSPKITCACAPPAAHGANPRANTPYSRAKPGTWKFTDDFIFQTGPFEDRSPCLHLRPG